MNNLCSKCHERTLKEYKKILDREYTEKYNKFIKTKYKDYEKKFKDVNWLLLYLLSGMMSEINDTENENKIFKKEWKCDCKISDKRQLMRSCNCSRIYNLLVDYDVFGIMRKAKMKKIFKFANVTRKKLIEFREDVQPFDEDWRGFDYYYLRLFNFSYFLKDKIPDKRNMMLNRLREEIYTHPLASHGFRYEQWEELQAILEEGIG